MKVWTGNEMERRGGEWDREMTAGRIRTRVPVGVQARIWLRHSAPLLCNVHLTFCPIDYELCSATF